MPIVLVAVWGTVFLSLLDDKRPTREAALAAFTVVSVAALSFAEALSPLHALSFGWLAAAWTALLVVLVATLRRRIVRGIRCLRASRASTWDVWDWVVAIVLGVFAAGTLASALLYPITNADSLTYHLPRVFFWFQNHSVARFPTSEARQLFSSAFAEYFVLNLKILVGGSDRLANTVQWLSYVFSVLAVSLIALRLGASRRGQQVAALAAAVTPMAILQASTTQNDLTCALWSLAAVYCVVSYIVDAPSERRVWLWWALWAGASLALAFQTKPPAYIVCAPFLVWLTVVALRRDGLRRFAAVAAVAIACVLVLNSGWYVANARLFGADIIGTNAPGNDHILIKDRDPSSVVTNALKNTSMLLGTPSARVNDVVANGVKAIVATYGGNMENPRTTEAGSGPYQVDAQVLNQDVGPSPVTVGLIVFAAVTVIFVRGPSGSRARWYLLCGASALLLTAGLITWNHYINRVLLGSLLVLVPLVGVALSALDPVPRRLLRGVLVGLLGVSVAWGAAVMLFDSTNRLLPPRLLPFKTSNRDVGYWNTSYGDLRFRILVPQYEQPYKSIAAIIDREGFQRVGIDSTALSVPIYPLLSLLADKQVAYVRDTLLPGKIPPSSLQPQVIVEVISASQYPAALSKSPSHGELLFGPAFAGNEVFLLYRAP